MLFAEYAHLLASPVQRDVSGNSTEKMKNFINLVIRRTRELTARPSEQKINVLFKQKTSAFKNAPEKAGYFPVILFALNAAYSKQVMCEYLASHGFIVVSGGEPLDPIMRNTVRIVQRESNARDLEFLMSYITDLPTASKTKRGLILWSSTSIGGLIFQMRNMQADAILSLEGHEAFATGVETLQNSPYFNPVSMRVPFMRMEIPNRLDGRWATDHSILDSFKYAERYFLTFHTLEHNDIGTSFAMMLGLVPESKKYGYENVCRYALRFFNAYLKDDKKSLTFLQKTPEAHGLKNDFLTLERKSALPAIPTRAEFLQFVLDENEIDKGVEIFTEATMNNPEVVLFEEWMFNRIGYNFLRAGKADKAAKIFWLMVSANPESANAYDSLGEAYMKNQQTELAMKSYKKSLELNPENSNAAEMLKKLQAK